VSIYYTDGQITLHHGDALDVARTLDDAAVDCIVTSPPYYGLRDYDDPGQYGLEASPAEYVEHLRALFCELRRVLADDGTCWLNIADSYARDHDDRPLKSLLGIPWRTAFALQDDGWILRNAIVWHKPNTTPESVTDRLACRYEHVFLFTQSTHAAAGKSRNHRYVPARDLPNRYWFDLDPIREPHSPISIDRSQRSARRRYSGNGRSGMANVPGLGPHGAISAGKRTLGEGGANPGDVWSIPTRPFPDAHFAVYPIELPLRCIQAGCKPGGTVCDPFHGSGTTGQAAQRVGRRYIGVDLNADYLDMSLRTRLSDAALPFDTP
jgi:site-specific DNA-methyltransferase (cytosine-N4-specific)